MNLNQVVLVPDSFKGSLSSQEVCRIMAEQITRQFPQCRVISLPVADGGEGSVDCFLSGGGEKRSLAVQGPFGEQVEAFYGLIDNGRTAVIEMASCAGLPLANGCLDPLRATTYGVGQLMLDAATRGCEKLILCLGGSCTNDMGAGAAAACGVRFMNATGNTFVPTGGSLKDVVSIDMSGLAPALKNIEIVAMCDVDSPLYGLSGAAYVFAPQKGADANAVRLLDNGLRHLGAKVKECLDIAVDVLPGGGAAGGMGAGVYAFFGAKLQMGIEVVLHQFRFDELLNGTHIVLTGEGRLDTQSLRGKVVAGVAHHAKAHNVPVIAVVGDIGDDIDRIYDEGVSAVFSINREAKPFEQVCFRSAVDLRLAMENVLRLIQIL